MNALPTINGNPPAGHAMSPIAKQLRRIRLDRGLSLDAAAKLTGGEFPPMVIGSYERGDRNPPVTRLQALLAFYGYDIEIVRKDES